MQTLQSLSKVSQVACLLSLPSLPYVGPTAWAHRDNPPNLLLMLTPSQQ